jgi:ATP-dependent Clp protease ATP-binding subunit ClpA
MDIGIGVQIAWRLAIEEAAAEGAAELEPGHFVCGVLKLAEMPTSSFRDAVPDAAMVSALEENQRKLCKALEDLGVRVPDHSKPLRRELRSLLRKAHPRQKADPSAVIHRSPATKALFAQAESAAHEAGEEEVTAARLVEMLLTNPDEALASALANIGNVRIDALAAAGKGSNSWIDDYGCDLTRLASQENSNETRVETIRRDAVCRVLAESLFNGLGVKAPAILLIARGQRSASVVVNDLAFWLVSSKPPAGVRRSSILEIHSATVLNRESKGSPELRLEEIFQRTLTSKNTVLFFDDFHRYLTTSIAGKRLARRFQTLLSNSKTSCVLGMTQKQYEKHIEKAVAWHKGLRLIWIHDARPNFRL